MHSNSNKRYFLSAWLICGLGAIYYSYEYLLRISPSVMEPALRAHFHLSATGFGFLSAFYYYAYVPMQVPVGILLDRFGPRRLLTFACFVCAIGTFLFASTSIVWVAALGRFLVGFGSAFAFVGVLKLATIWLPEDKLALVSGLAAALGTIGAMLGDNLLGEFVTKIGWRPTVEMTAYFGLFLAIILWLGIRDKNKAEGASGTIASFHKSMIDLGIIIKNKQMWINGAIGCLVYLPTTVFAELWGIPYLKHAHHLTTASADFANSLLFLGFTVGAPLMGFISDKIKRRKLPLLIGASGAAIVMMAVLYIPNLNELSIQILMFMLGLFYSAQCIVFAVGRELSPNEAAGTAMALTNMIVMFGAMFLQPLVGRLLDFSLASHANIVISADKLGFGKLHSLYTADDYQFALSVIPLGIIIAAILTFFLKETYAITND
ncbi:major facilitator family transporter [Legionella busanensis]|uniref:Lysosomal dipeptide transporter MFSD1 n=1 Tax=Legionella busanensis TaxID=190655 RepID=A0A378JMY7_9GAMM|nr:MFS transporter [Legionella busanensis]STX52604.1 major facilitator family transporter [Legionella busanensis]